MHTSIFDKIGGTRFILLLVMAFIGGFLTYTGRLDGTTYWGFLTANFVGYVGGRVIDNKNAMENDAPV